MNKLFLSGLIAGLFIPSVASADIVVKLPKDSGIDSLSVSHAPIIKFANAKSKADLGLVEEMIPVVDDKAMITIDQAEGGSRYSIVFSDSGYFNIYALPGENITAEVPTFSPLTINLSGTPLIDAMNEIDGISEPFEERQQKAMEAGETSQEVMMGIYNDYLAALKEYINSNIDSPNVVYAMMNLNGEDYVEAFDQLGENAKTSILYPLAESKYKSVQQSLEQERKQQAMASGDVEAPNFTLKNLDGKDVSLTDFRGKWVILDFWGSWCIWCIKGFPELKEAYEKYKNELEVVGIDCRESEDAWRAGVAKYELPWVNVYCPDGNPLIKEFGIQGYPTKAIIDPQGKIRNITTGHNPEFFTILSELMGK